MTSRFSFSTYMKVQQDIEEREELIKGVEYNSLIIDKASGNFRDAELVAYDMKAVADRAASSSENDSDRLEYQIELDQYVNEIKLRFYSS